MPRYLLVLIAAALVAACGKSPRKPMSRRSPLSRPHRRRRLPHRHHLRQRPHIDVAIPLHGLV